MVKLVNSCSIRSGVQHLASNIWIILLLSQLFPSCQNHIELLKETKEFPNYPSASGIEYFNKHFYIIGDDATSLLQLDSTLGTIDSIPLYTSASKRIPKDTKADLEAITMVSWQKRPHLLVIGSGSLDSSRNTGWLIDPVTKEKTLLHLDVFYDLLRSILQGAKQDSDNILNLEGLCSIPGFTILANRGHSSFPRNYLVFASPEFWVHQGSAEVKAIKVGVNDDTTAFKGISGLAYASGSDKLLLTVSTENTKNAYEDGAIGKSYIWIIDNISSKRRLAAINPNRMIDLESIDQRFKGQKIESACVIKETRNMIHLGLVADNDKGTSSLFTLNISKN